MPFDGIRLRLLGLAVIVIGYFQVEHEIFSFADDLFPQRVATKFPSSIHSKASLPPLDSLIGDGEHNITANVDWLLDFVIAGHPKTATTSMMDWFYYHARDICIWPEEIRALSNDNPAELVERLYELPAQPGQKRGYKAPNDIRIPSAIQALHDYWPSAKIIVGIRHPILWFQSWYNFKGRHDLVRKWPAPEDMIGDAIRPQVLYHNNLFQLGKTQQTPQELDLLWPETNGVSLKAWKMPNKVFLYDYAQYADRNATRYLHYRQDLSQFLGLSETLPPCIETSDHIVLDPDFVNIDICHARYRALRKELQDVGRRAARWMMDYFIDHPDVTISSRDYLMEQLQTYGLDPCEAPLKLDFE